MLIEIDTNFIKKNGITPSQMVFIELLKLKKYSEISNMLDLLNISKSDIDKLIDINVFTADSYTDFISFENLKFTRIFDVKVNITDDFFNEFSSTYPTSVIRIDGTMDFLKQNLSKCKEIYSAIVGKDKDKHNYIMKALRFEINQKTQFGKLGYMKRMMKWLRDEEYLSYSELSKISESIRPIVENNYGTTVE